MLVKVDCLDERRTRRSHGVWEQKDATIYVSTCFFTKNACTRHLARIVGDPVHDQVVLTNTRRVENVIEAVMTGGVEDEEETDAEADQDDEEGEKAS